MVNKRPRKYKLKYMKRLGDWGHSKAFERKIRPMRSYPCIPSQIYLKESEEFKW